jgi:hypothetical protein
VRVYDTDRLHGGAHDQHELGCCARLLWAREREGEREIEWMDRGDGARTRRGEGGPAVPRDELTGAWLPHGVCGLARSGRRARARAGRAGSLRWAEREAQTQIQRKIDFSFLFSNNSPQPQI